MFIRDQFEKLNSILQGDPLITKRLIIKANTKRIEVEVNDNMTTWEFFQYVKHHPLIPQPQNLIALKSLCGSVTLDYVLSLQQQEASVTVNRFKSSEVLVAVYCTQTPSAKLCLKDFIFERCVGKGGTSEVYLVRHILSGRLFALKMIKKQYVSDCRRLEQILRERKILTEILNQSSIPLHATFASKDYLSFLMEFSPGGEMFFHLQNYRFEEEQVKIYFCEVLSALEELHVNKVLYRDLKPENILIDLNGHISLTDFGLSKVGLQDDQMTYSFCGSPEYMPPEIIGREGYSYAADFYTLGCLLYELLVGIPPHYSQDAQEIFTNIQNHEIEYPEELSQELVEILKALLNKQPQNRVKKFSQLKKMRWLRNVDWDSVQQKKSQAPIVIDLYQTNIHEEFLGIAVDELNISNQKGLLESTEDLFQFFDYINPTSSHLFKQSSVIKQNRVFSDHQIQITRLKKKNLKLNLEMEKNSLSRIQSCSIQKPLINSSLTPQTIKHPKIIPIQVLRKNFQKLLKQSSLRLDDTTQKSKSREKSRQTLLTERGGQFDKHKLALDQLLQSPLMQNSTKSRNQQSFPTSDQGNPRKVKSVSSTKATYKSQQGLPLAKKSTPNNSITKHPLQLNLDIVHQHYNSIYSLITPSNNKSREQTYSHHYQPYK